MRTVLGLVLVSMLIGMCFVQLVTANPFSFVPTSGPQVSISKDSVEALNSKGIYEPANDIAIKRDGVYYLTKDLSGMWCIALGEDIILDGAGHSINSTSEASIGVSVRGFENVTIKNIQINGFRYGIGFSEVKNSLITNVTVSNCYRGVNIDNSRAPQVAASNQVVKCNIDNNGYGLSISSSGNSFSENTLVLNSKAISIFCCQNNTYSKNVITGSKEVAVEFQYANAAQKATKPTDNTFYDNSFINNAKQVSMAEVKGVNNIVDSSFVNQWSLNQKGNYWSDHSGSGSYIIDENNVDSYPLNQPVEINSIAIPTTNTGPDPISINPMPFVLGLLAILAMVAVLILLYKRRTMKQMSTF